jgi:hypothetical protein
MQYHSFKKRNSIMAASQLMVIAADLTKHEDENVLGLVHALLDRDTAEVARLKLVILEDFTQQEFGTMVKAVMRNRTFVRDLLDQRTGEKLQ